MIVHKMRAITALALSLAATLATAQGAPTTAPPLLQVPSSGASVSGRVSEPAQEPAPATPITSAASHSGAAKAGYPKAVAPAVATAVNSPFISPTAPAEPAGDVPAVVVAPAPTSVADESPQPTEWERMQEVIEPIIRNPLVGAGALLTMMLLLAVLAYRRNRRNDALVLSSPQWVADETATPEAPKDPLMPTRGLQAEILALNLELGASDAPSQSPSSAPFLEPYCASSNSTLEPFTPTIPTPSSAEDLSLSKLQLAQKLLAAGENELARVLLTSVTEALHSQLQSQLHPRGDSPQGPRQ